MAAKKCAKCNCTTQKSDSVACMTCFSENNIVINSLLMCANTYRSRSTALQMKTTVTQFYSADELTDARQVMLDHVKDLIPDLPNLNKRRVELL